MKVRGRTEVRERFEDTLLLVLKMRKAHETRIRVSSCKQVLRFYSDELDDKFRTSHASLGDEKITGALSCSYSV